MSGRAGRLRLVCGVPPRVRLGLPCFPKAVVLLPRTHSSRGPKTTARVSPARSACGAFVNDLGPRVEVNRPAAPHRVIQTGNVSYGVFDLPVCEPDHRCGGQHHDPGCAPAEAAALETPGCTAAGWSGRGSVAARKVGTGGTRPLATQTCNPPTVSDPRIFTGRRRCFGVRASTEPGNSEQHKPFVAKAAGFNIARDTRPRSRPVRPPDRSTDPRRGAVGGESLGQRL